MIRVAYCTLCGWEGQAADDLPGAAQDGYNHLRAIHAPLAADGDFAVIRIATFHQLTADDIAPAEAPQPEPAPAAQARRIAPPAPEPKPQPRAQARRKEHR